jgi:hypothetical protein
MQCTLALDTLWDGICESESISKDNIEDFVNNWLEKLIMSGLDYIFQLAGRTTGQVSDEECETFEDACTYIGYLWRDSFEGTTVPPKLHLLETHLPEQLRYFRILGIFLEDPIERLHKVDNDYNRLFANIKCFKRRELQKGSRGSYKFSPQLKKHLGENEDLSRRRFSNSSVIKKQELVTKSMLKRKAGHEYFHSIFQISCTFCYFQDGLEVHLQHDP